MYSPNRNKLTSNPDRFKTTSSSKNQNKMQIESLGAHGPNHTNTGGSKNTTPSRYLSNKKGSTLKNHENGKVGSVEEPIFIESREVTPKETVLTSQKKKVYTIEDTPEDKLHPHKLAGAHGHCETKPSCIEIEEPASGHPHAEHSGDMASAAQGLFDNGIDHGKGVDKDMSFNCQPNEMDRPFPEEPKGDSNLLFGLRPSTVPCDPSGSPVKHLLNEETNSSSKDTCHFKQSAEGKEEGEEANAKEQKTSAKRSKSGTPLGDSKSEASNLLSHLDDNSLFPTELSFNDDCETFQRLAKLEKKDDKGTTHEGKRLLKEEQPTILETQEEMASVSDVQPQETMENGLSGEPNHALVKLTEELNAGAENSNGTKMESAPTNESLQRMDCNNGEDSHEKMEGFDPTSGSQDGMLEEHRNEMQVEMKEEGMKAETGAGDEDNEMKDNEESEPLGNLEAPVPRLSIEKTPDNEKKTNEANPMPLRHASSSNYLERKLHEIQEGNLRTSGASELGHSSSKLEREKLIWDKQLANQTKKKVISMAQKSAGKELGVSPSPGPRGGSVRKIGAPLEPVGKQSGKKTVGAPVSTVNPNTPQAGSKKRKFDAIRSESKDQTKGGESQELKKVKKMDLAQEAAVKGLSTSGKKVAQVKPNMLKEAQKQFNDKSLESGRLSLQDKDGLSGTKTSISKENLEQTQGEGKKETGSNSAKVSAHKPAKCCAYCGGAVEVKTQTKMLSCLHKAHVDCYVAMEKKKKANCPLCNSNTSFADVQAIYNSAKKTPVLKF